MRCADCGEIHLGGHACNKKNVKHKNLGSITFDFLDPGPQVTWDQLVNVICAILEEIPGVKNVNVREEGNGVITR